MALISLDETSSLVPCTARQLPVILVPWDPLPSLTSAGTRHTKVCRHTSRKNTDEIKQTNIFKGITNENRVGVMETPFITMTE